MNTGLKVIAAGLLCSAFAGTASAEPWSRGYAVEWIEAASHFEGKETDADKPGPDCPKGVNTLDMRKILAKPGRSAEEIDRLMGAAQQKERYMAIAFRGTNGEYIYAYPKSAPDPGLLEVQSKIAEGFNLDDNARTGFTSPTGERGIDNQFYKTVGCEKVYRGPPRKTFMGTYFNETIMHNGDFTDILLISGKKDMRNDDDVTVGIYTSKDKLVKDANGDIESDTSFRIPDDAIQLNPHTYDPLNYMLRSGGRSQRAEHLANDQYANVLKAKITDGVLELTVPQGIMMRTNTYLGDLTLHKARIRFKLNPEGPIEGLIGGYEPIKEAYEAWASTGIAEEVFTDTNIPALYYGLERNADAEPDPKTGKNTAISTAFRVWAIPAFIIKPDGSGPAEVAQMYSTAQATTP